MLNEQQIRRKIINQIERIPVDKLKDVSEFLKRIESNRKKPNRILSFAGMWSDMEDEAYDQLAKEYKLRRKNRESRF